MKLENQVCSLDLSKRLKELGVKQKSLFWWEPSSNRKDANWKLKLCEFDCGCLYDDHCDADPEGYIYERENCVSAFTVGELGEMLPVRLYKLEDSDKRYEHGAWLGCDKDEDGGWIIGYGENCQNYLEIDASIDTEADARAKMLIYLLENKLITL